MNNRKPAIPLKLRWSAILLGVAFFAWLPFEEPSTTLVLLLAIALSAWLAVRLLTSGRKPFHGILPNYLLAGVLGGLMVTPLALFLMAFKIGLHAHWTPDFSTEQIASALARTPLWIFGGALIGLGSGLWTSAAVKQEHEHAS